MPTYSYRCTECDHAFDIRQEFSDAALTECPECGGKLRKIFGNLGVTFSGSGFYRTDSRASSSAASGSSSTSEKSASGSASPSGGSSAGSSGGSSGS